MPRSVAEDVGITVCEAIAESATAEVMPCESRLTFHITARETARADPQVVYIYE